MSKKSKAIIILNPFSLFRRLMWLVKQLTEHLFRSLWKLMLACFLLDNNVNKKKIKRNESISYLECVTNCRSGSGLFCGVRLEWRKLIQRSFLTTVFGVNHLRLKSHIIDGKL